MPMWNVAPTSTSSIAAAAARRATLEPDARMLSARTSSGLSKRPSSSLATDETASAFSAARALASWPDAHAAQPDICVRTFAYLPPHSRCASPKYTVEDFPRRLGPPPASLRSAPSPVRARSGEGWSKRRANSLTSRSQPLAARGCLAAALLLSLPRRGRDKRSVRRRCPRVSSRVAADRCGLAVSVDHCGGLAFRFLGTKKPPFRHAVPPGPVLQARRRPCHPAALFGVSAEFLCEVHGCAPSPP